MHQDDQLFEMYCLKEWEFVVNKWKGWGERWPQDAYMRPLITTFLARGYDRCLFPRPYNYTFALARTRNIQDMNQPRLMFAPRGNPNMGILLFGAGLGLRLEELPADITPAVENLLNLLLAYPIDYDSLEMLL